MTKPLNKDDQIINALVKRRIFDAHLHIIDPRFPLIANQGFTPDPFDIAAYRCALEGLNVTGGAVVAGSFQGFDLTWLAAALGSLGPSFVGVAQLPTRISDTELKRLNSMGVRAVRFNLRRNRHPDPRGMIRLAHRAHALAGWHSELYVDAAELPNLMPMLRALPRLVIDHLGLSRAGLPHLLPLVARGAWVKATGFGRLDFDPAKALAAIHRENPHALLFGTDLPSTRATRPFARTDLDLIASVLGDETALDRVLRANALALYRPRSGSELRPEA